MLDILLSKTGYRKRSRKNFFNACYCCRAMCLEVVEYGW